MQKAEGRMQKAEAAVAAVLGSWARGRGRPGSLPCHVWRRRAGVPACQFERLAAALWCSIIPPFRKLGAGCPKNRQAGSPPYHVWRRRAGVPACQSERLAAALWCSIIHLSRKLGAGCPKNRQAGSPPYHAGVGVGGSDVGALRAATGRFGTAPTLSRPLLCGGRGRAWPHCKELTETQS